MAEQACKRAGGPFIELQDLPEQLQWAADADAHPSRADQSIDLDQLLTNVEREVIQRAIRQAKGNKTRAAALLGINRARLHRRLEQLGIR